MAGKREMKREDLRSRLIEAARSRIVSDGVAALRARDVTQDAGCALGGLYTVFSDLYELVLHVNSATLKSLEDSLALQDIADAPPADRLRHLARGYLRFALANRNLWMSLFESRPPEGHDVPQWHLDEHLFLIGFIVEPLGQMQPDMSVEARAIRARTLFGAVHGIVSLSVDGRFVGLPPDRLEGEIDDLLQTIAAGAEHRR
jgi:AcrR family transcriptional regulator